MVKYIEFKGEQTPIIFGNAAFYQYEKTFGGSALSGFANAIPQNENGEFDVTNVKIAFFVDFTMCAFIAAGNITRKPFTGNEYDVAAWMDGENLIKVMEMITESLPRQKDDAQEVAGDSNEAGELKK
jgi:hypothetical protein